MLFIYGRIRFYFRWKEHKKTIRYRIPSCRKNASRTKIVLWQGLINNPVNRQKVINNQCSSSTQLSRYWAIMRRWLYPFENVRVMQLTFFLMLSPSLRQIHYLRRCAPHLEVINRHKIKLIINVISMGDCWSSYMQVVLMIWYVLHVLYVFQWLWCLTFKVTVCMTNGSNIIKLIKAPILNPYYVYSSLL